MTVLLVGAGMLYGLIVAATFAWLQLQGRLDRLELLTFPDRRTKEL